MSAIQRRDRGNEWWVDFRWRGRRVRRRAPLQTKRGAEAFERQLRNEFSEDEAHGMDPLAIPPTFADFAERWMREYVAAYNRPTSAREKRSYLTHHLLPAFGRLPLNEIGTEQVDRFVAVERERVCPKTLNNVLTTLRCSLRLASEWGLLRRPPRIRGVRVSQRVIVFLKDDELDRLVAAAPTARWRAFFTVLADTGMRFGEAAALQWSDVDLIGPEPAVAVVRAAALGVVGPTKTGNTRTIPLPERATRELVALPRSSSNVFQKADGGVLRPECNLKVLHRACARAGVPRIGWHGLRHTYATRLCQRGVPLRNVQALLGHTTILMTSRYAHEGDLGAWVHHALDRTDGHLMVTKPSLAPSLSSPATRFSVQPSKNPA